MLLLAAATGCESWWVDPAAYEGGPTPPDFAVEMHIYPPAEMSEDDRIFAPEDRPPPLPEPPMIKGLSPDRPLVYILQPNRRLLVAQPSHGGASREIIASKSIKPDRFDEVFDLAMREDLIEARTTGAAEGVTPQTAYEGLLEVHITAYNRTNTYRATVAESPGSARLATLLAQLAEPAPGGYH